MTLLGTMTRLTSYTIKLVRLILLLEHSAIVLMAAYSGVVHARTKMYVLKKGKEEEPYILPP